MNTKFKSGRRASKSVCHSLLETASQSTASRTAFTLIELLVVIAIITALSALVITVVPMVRDASRQTVCAGNLRQILVSQLSYAQDWKGQLQPMFHTKIGSYYPAQYWTSLMDVLVKDHGLNRASFFCPSAAGHDSDDSLFGHSDWDFYGKRTGTSYAYVANPMMGEGNSHWLNFSAVPRRTFDRPAQTVIISDLLLTAESSCLPQGNYMTNHLRSRQLSSEWQTDRKMLRGTNQGSVDGRVAFKPGSAFPESLDARTGPNFNATLTHCWEYNWGFFF